MVKETKELGLQKALDMMRKPDTRLMLMHTSDGDHFYIVPGGRVRKDDADKIIKRPDVHLFDDGLFPGNPQSWKLGAI